MPMRMTLTRMLEKNVTRYSHDFQSGEAVKVQPTARMRPAPLSMATGKKLRVFLVEDSQVVVERVIALLATVEGVEIVGAARTASAAIRGIQHLLPDLVILDFQLPDGKGLAVLKTIRQGPQSPLVMMLTNFAIPQYRAECMHWGANYFFDKSQDSERIVAACRHLLAVNETQFGDDKGVNNQNQIMGFSKRVLVVEDDDTNRWLVSRLLEQKGYLVSSVINWQAALAVVKQESIALILTDMRMLVRDAVTASQVIDQQNQPAGTHIPTVAFTLEAGAAQGQHCPEAGIDGCLTKPLQTEVFYRTIEAVLTFQSRQVQAIDKLPIFAYEEALARVDNKVETLQGGAETFFRTSLHLLAALRRAIAKNDPYNLDFAAHRLKSAASNLSAYRVVELAERLELIGRIRNLSKAQAIVALIELEIDHFKAAFAAATQTA